MHNGGLYDALLDAPDLRLVITRHEQGAAFMADGYARASGRTACVVTITGPGITNASTGLAEAYGESSPVLHIATALGVRSEPAETGELHELRDQSGLLQALVAHHQLVESVSDIPHAIHRGLRAMADDRPGPVSIEIPLDLLTATDEVALPDRLHTPPRTPSPEAVDRAAALLADADAPLLFLGSGAMDAGPEAAALAERLHAPVLTAQTGKGAIPESHQLALGCKNRRDESLYEFLRTRDLVLVVGCRLGARMTEDGRMPLAASVDPDRPRRRRAGALASGQRGAARRRRRGASASCWKRCPTSRRRTTTVSTPRWTSCAACRRTRWTIRGPRPSWARCGRCCRPRRCWSTT